MTINQTTSKGIEQHRILKLKSIAAFVTGKVVNSSETATAYTVIDECASSIKSNKSRVKRARRASIVRVCTTSRDAGVKSTK